MSFSSIDEEEVGAGKVGPHRESHEPRLNGLELLADGVTPVQGFVKWSGVQPIGEKWGMASNAQFGCCGFSAWQHYNDAKAAASANALWRQIGLRSWAPHFASLLPAYFAYGIAQGEPGPRPDDGVDNATMLAWAYKLGLIDGYFEVPKGYEDWFAMTFHGAIVGQALDGTTAIADFDAVPRRPWDAMGKTDGHDTLLIEGDGQGGGAEVTWGGVQPFTPAYRQTNWTDVWVIVDRDDPNVDQTALKAILTELHGVVSSTPDVAENTSDLLDKIEHAIEKVPGHIVEALKHGHRLEEAIAEQASVAVIEDIVKALIKAYITK
jgi:hypothetical protein